MASFSWPAAAQKPQSASSTTWPGGVILPLWINHEAYSFDGSQFTLLEMPPGGGDSPPAPYLSRTGKGYQGSVADGTTGAWLMASSNFLTYLPYPNTQSGFIVDLTGSGGVPEPAGALSAASQTGGLRYFTITPTQVGDLLGAGICLGSASVDNLLDLSAAGTQEGLVYFSDGTIRAGGVLLATADAWIANTSVQIAMDLNAPQFWVRSGTGDWNGDPSADPATYSGGLALPALIASRPMRFWTRQDGGNWNNDPTADPATNVGGFDMAPLLGYTLYVTGAANNATITYNFGSTGFSYAVPMGFTSGVPHVGGGFTSFNPSAVQGGISLSGGNLTLSSGGSLGTVPALDGASTGAYYYEFTVDGLDFFTNTTGGGPARLGATSSFLMPSGHFGSGDPNGGAVVNIGQFNTYPVTVGIAGTQSSVIGNAGTVHSIAFLLSETSPIFAFAGGYTQTPMTTLDANFGGSSFTPSAPAGYSAFNAATAFDPASLSGPASLTGANLLLDIETTPPFVNTTANTGLTATGAVASGNAAICVDASGVVFITSTRNPGIVESISPGYGDLARDLSANETNLYTALPRAGALGVMALSGRTFSSLLTPMKYPASVRAAATGVAIAVAGWDLAVVASGAAYFASNPSSPGTQAVFSSPIASGVVLIEGSDPAWGVVSVATGQAGCGPVAWNPDGTQVLVACETSVNILNIVGGHLTQTQSLMASAPGRMSVTPDGTNALVCQPTADSIAVLINTLDIWSLGTPVSLTAPQSVLITSDTAGYALANGNLYSLFRTGDVWTPTLLFSLGYTGANLTIDAQDNLYVVGTAGADGFLSLVQDNALANTVTWVGSGDDVTVLQAQAAVLDLTGARNLILDVPLHDILGINILGLGGFAGTIRMFGLLGNALVDDSSQPTAAIPILPPRAISFGTTPDSVWLCGDELYQCSWEAPYEIRNRRAGRFALYDGSEWGLVDLGVGHDPAAMTWDATGNVELVSQQNDLYTFSGVVSGVAVPLVSLEEIPVYPGQLAGTPLGMSSLTWYGGALYAGTLFSGTLVKVR